MTPDHPLRGGASVATLSQTDLWQAKLILHLRLWCDGPEGQAQVWNTFAKALPRRTARQEMHRFGALTAVPARTSRRPPVRHILHCVCLRRVGGMHIRPPRCSGQCGGSDRCRADRAPDGIGQPRRTCGQTRHHDDGNGRNKDCGKGRFCRSAQAGTRQQKRPGADHGRGRSTGRSIPLESTISRSRDPTVWTIPMPCSINPLSHPDYRARQVCPPFSRYVP